MKFLVLIFVIACGNAQSPSSTVILDRVAGPDYDWRLRPPPVPTRGAAANGPTRVMVNAYFRRIRPTDDGLEVEVTFRQSWNDSRLSYTREIGPGGPAYVHADKSRKIWQPDTFFQNAYDIKMEGIPAPNELLRVYQNGQVLSSQKLSMKLVCPMIFERFPGDDQRCNMDFASYAYTTDDIIYEWKNDTPIQLKAGLEKSMTQFELKSVTTDQCTSKTNTGVYSCLRAILHLERTKGVNSAKLYIIPLLLVVLSWLPMILNAQSILLRVLVQLICLATLILHWSIIGGTLPAVGYSTGADVWLTRCLGFIAATFVQLIFFVWIVRATAAHKERKLAKERFLREKVIVDADEDVVLVRTEPIYKKERSMGISLLVDLISLAIFVLAFLVFLLHYFTRY